MVLKALATKPEQRYPTVEALRRDIERYQEGRSVSAKHDTMRELAWKMIKRNVAASLVTAVAIVLLGRCGAETPGRAIRSRSCAASKFVPAFVEAAHAAVQRKKFDQALVQISMAVEYDPDHAEAKLLKGQLLVVRGDFEKGRTELEGYRRLKPKDDKAAELIELCRKGKSDDTNVVAAIADVLRRQNALVLAASMVQSREHLFARFKQNIDSAWKGLGANLKMDKDGNCTFELPPWNLDPNRSRTLVTDLAPLKGIPLVRLDLSGCDQIEDISVLQGMPLTWLNLDGCKQIKDLAPLEGAPLVHLNLGGLGQVFDLTPLQGMALTDLYLHRCGEIKDLGPLQGMPLDTLNLHFCVQIKDLSPLKGMPLRSLTLNACVQVKDLGPLRGSPIGTLDMTRCILVRDLTPLEGMPLTSLNLHGCEQVRDFSPLRGLPIATLNLSYCGQIADLEVLRSLPLTSLTIFANGRIKDLSPLAGKKITGLSLNNCPGVADLSPLRSTSVEVLDLGGCSKITDFSPLATLPLKTLNLTAAARSRTLACSRARRSTPSIVRTARC